MELVEIVDENNVLTGQIEERWTACAKGLWRRSVSCWIMNKNGEILLQKRALTKRRNPGKWAKTGGAVDAYETPDEAIKREVKEELGIDVNVCDENKIDIWKSNVVNNKYFAYNYIFLVDFKEDEFNIQKEELDEVKYYTIEQIKKLKENNDKDYTLSDWDDSGFYEQIEMLKGKRNQICNK